MKVNQNRVLAAVAGSSNTAPALVAMLALAVMLTLLWSDPARADTGKLLLTGGVTTVDGAAGGGISPWALVGTNATEGEVGLSASVSRLPVQDYALSSVGLALALDNRWEASLSQQDLDASVATRLNSLGFGVTSGEHIRLNTVGVKARLVGEAVLDSDNSMPQIAVGLLYKQTDSGSIKPVLQFLGARSDGVEAYVSASKLWLRNSLLLNGTLRYTNANQGGLLGFGSSAAGTDLPRLVPEFSAAWLLSRHLAVGAEVRFNPNELEAAGQAAGLNAGLAADNWADVFVAWAPNKNWSLTLAYVDLGRILPAITNNKTQNGVYVAVQFAL